MLPGNIESDVAIAKRICKGLGSGEKECLGELVTIYHEFFSNFARRRLLKSDLLEDVLQSFWEEMLNGRAICAYAHGSKNTATLQTYLLGVLHRRVIDANRKTSRYEEMHRAGENLPETPDQALTPHDVLAGLTSNNLARRLLYQALLKLSEEYPQDATLVRMYLEGLDHRQMAARIGKRVDAVKKQFTREATGSLEKFKRALKRLMQAQGLRYEDIWESEINVTFLDIQTIK
jgi:RNA polymerase sigma factor (sigma-70 family)